MITLDNLKYFGCLILVAVASWLIYAEPYGLIGPINAGWNLMMMFLFMSAFMMVLLVITRDPQLQLTFLITTILPFIMMTQFMDFDTRYKELRITEKEFTAKYLIIRENKISELSEPHKSGLLNKSKSFNVYHYLTLENYKTFSEEMLANDVFKTELLAFVNDSKSLKEVTLKLSTLKDSGYL